MHGFLILDKPKGWSSSKALSPLRRTLGRSVRIGHAGTLDPFASGLLIVMLGDATRLSRIAMSLEKHYIARIQFGLGTDTLDCEGEVVDQQDPGPYEPMRLLDAISMFQGKIEQMPPAYSALKVGGRRAYRLAREGKEVVLEPRQVMIHHMAVQSVRWPFVDISVTCGSGTYIRALARDLGAALGLPAHLTELRRLRIGPFDTDSPNALPCFDELTNENIQSRLVPPGFIVRAANLPSVQLSPELSLDFVFGKPVEVDCATTDDTTEIAVIGCTNASEEPLFLGLAKNPEDGSFRSTTVLSSARIQVEDNR
ncbi:MAG: tRNA pseudouridine(55) synthase TruB [Myxococcales bacterium]|nr:tRNA pseudouridine(55) synthase TruB [Myxococcales bacterium]